MFVCVCVCVVYLLFVVQKYSTVHSDSIQTPFTFFNFVMLQPDTTIV